MADIANLPDSGSAHAVAFRLYDRLDAIVPRDADIRKTIQRHLDLYSACLATVQGEAPKAPDFT